MDEEIKIEEEVKEKRKYTKKDPIVEPVQAKASVPVQRESMTSTNVKPDIQSNERLTEYIDSNGKVAYKVLRRIRG